MTPPPDDEPVAADEWPEPIETDPLEQQKAERRVQFEQAMALADGMLARIHAQQLADEDVWRP